MMQDSFILQFFSFGAICLLAFSLVFLALELFRICNPFKALIKKSQNQTAFFLSLSAVAGSLLLSTYFNFPPCELCWWQRVLMFPIPLIAFVGVVKNDVQARSYAFILSLIGAAVALIHTFLQANIFKAVTAFCNPNSAIDCAVPTFTHFGFVTVPFISFSVFLALMISTYAYKE